VVVFPGKLAQVPGTLALIGPEYPGAELAKICFIERCLPERIKCDNVSEFICSGGRSKEMDLWTYNNSWTLNFSKMGKPTDNANLESFSGKFRVDAARTNAFPSIGSCLWRRKEI